MGGDALAEKITRPGGKYNDDDDDDAQICRARLK